MSDNFKRINVLLFDMAETNKFFVTSRVNEMIRRYAAKPDEFFIGDGRINGDRLEELVEKYIAIKPGVRGGYACIKGTRIAVCDIIVDTWHLSNPVGYENAMYGGTIPREAIDAAYSFLMLNQDKIEQDFKECYGYNLPKELYI